MDVDSKKVAVGCPAVSRDHFDSLCQLIDEDRLRPGARIPALTPARSGGLLGLDPPPGLRAEFAGVVRASADRVDAARGGLGAAEVWDMFEREYLLREPASALLTRCSARACPRPADPWITLFNIRQAIGTAQDNAALVVAGTLTAMGLDVTVLSRDCEVLQASGLTAAYVQCLIGFPVWGAGIGGDLTAASLKAVLSAVSRAELKRTQGCAA